MEKTVKYIVAPLITIVILSVVVYFFFKSILGTSVPDYEGEFEVAGLLDSVAIYTNREGIPFIKTSNTKDMFFTLGYLHARDRLLELEFNKLVAEGRLSEYFGSKMVNTDKYLRQLMLPTKAASQLKEINSTTLPLLQAYAGGINYCINSENVIIQSEFAATGIEPGEWDVKDIILLSLLENFRDEGKFKLGELTGLMKEKMGIEKAASVFGGAVDSAKVKEYSKIREYLLREETALRGQLGLMGDNSVSYKEISGIKGAFVSLNGSYTFPGRYYTVSYEVAGIKGSGITVPGVPVLYLGMKGEESWVLLTSKKDLRQKKITHFDDRGNLLVNGKIKGKTGLHKDTIKIKDSEPEILEILTGAEGEVITGKEPGEDIYNSDSTEVLKVYFAESFYLSGFNAAAFLNSGTGFWTENVSTKYFSYEANTEILYKAKSEAVKLVATKSVVQKETQEPSSKKKKPAKKKAKPVVVKESQKDQPTDESVEFVKVTESGDITGDGFFRLVPSVSERQWLQKPEGKNIPSFLLNDVTSDFSLKMVPLIINAFSGATKKDTNITQSLRVISGWSGEFLSGLQAPLIMAEFLKYYTVNIFGDEFSKEDFEIFFGVGGYPLEILKELSSEKNALVYDLRNTSAIEDRDQIIRKSFTEALASIEKKYGDNLIMWLWGNENIFIPGHILGKLMGGISDVLVLETAGMSGFYDTQFRSAINPFSVWTGDKSFSGHGTLNRFYLEPERTILLTIPYLGNSGNFADKMSGVTYINFLEGKLISLAPFANENDKVLRLIKKM
ncbi:MAG: penicillin acylase family protein [Ignavibacteriaceae bacterium]|nr:penicillin acylase family protein [Ignavibacteriaceae bacterium]